MVKENNKKGGYLVCQGATVQCSHATSTIPIYGTQINNIFIKDCNGAQKMAITTKDVSDQAANSLICRRTNPPVACTPDLTWRSVYPNIEMSDGSRLLLHDSTARCSHCFAAKIRIVHHGQSMTPNVLHLDNMSVNMTPINPALDPLFSQERTTSRVGKPSVGMVKAYINDVECTGRNFHVHVKENKITFSATKYTGNKSYINWVINKDGKHFKTMNCCGPLLKDVVFNSCGVYTIEGYGEKPRSYPKCTHTVIVEENSIKEIFFIDQSGTKTILSMGKEESDRIAIFRGEYVTFQANYKYPEKGMVFPGLCWLIKDNKGGKTIIDRNFFNVEDSLFHYPIECEANFTVTSFSIKFKLKNYGVYSVILKNMTSFFANKIMTNVRLEVISVKPEQFKLDKNIYRPGEEIVAKVESLDAGCWDRNDNENIIWELLDNNREKIHLASFDQTVDEHGCPIVTLLKGKNEIKFSLSAGTYTLRVKSEKDFKIFDIKTMLNEEQTIHVMANHPLSVMHKLGGANIENVLHAFVKEKLYFKVEDYKIEPALKDERDCIKWAILKNEANCVESPKIIACLKGNGSKEYIERNGNDNNKLLVNPTSHADELAICFLEEGEYFVQPYMNFVDNTTSPANIKVVVNRNPDTEKTFWAITSEEKNKLGENQHIVCHVKHHRL